jgi:hypothetical protein
VAVDLEVDLDRRAEGREQTVAHQKRRLHRNGAQPRGVLMGHHAAMPVMAI